MNASFAHQRMRVDRQKVADLLNIDVSTLCLLPPSNRPGMFAYHYTCYHGSGRQFWLDNGKVNPNWMREQPVYINVLFDEDGICYGAAGVCPCGKAYFVAPTIELLEFLDAEAGRMQNKPIKPPADEEPVQRSTGALRYLESRSGSGDSL